MPATSRAASNSRKIGRAQRLPVSDPSFESPIIHESRDRSLQAAPTYFDGRLGETGRNGTRPAPLSVCLFRARSCTHVCYSYGRARVFSSCGAPLFGYLRDSLSRASAARNKRALSPGYLSSIVCRCGPRILANRLIRSRSRREIVSRKWRTADAAPFAQRRRPVDQ